MPAANISKYVDKENYCPFKCNEQQLDEHGYCCHLIGFTNRGKAMELVTYNQRGEIQVNGSLVEKVLKTDKLVNPEALQVDQDGTHMAKKWASFRVYRNCDPVKAEEWRKKHLAPRNEDEEVEELAAAV